MLTSCDNLVQDGINGIDDLKKAGATLQDGIKQALTKGITSGIQDALQPFYNMPSQAAQNAVSISQGLSAEGRTTKTNGSAAGLLDTSVGVRNDILVAVPIDVDIATNTTVEVGNGATITLGLIGTPKNQIDPAAAPAAPAAPAASHTASAKGEQLAASAATEQNLMELRGIESALAHEDSAGGRIGAPGADCAPDHGGGTTAGGGAVDTRVGVSNCINVSVPIHVKVHTNTNVKVGDNVTVAIGALNNILQ